VTLRARRESLQIFFEESIASRVRDEFATHVFDLHSCFDRRRERAPSHRKPAWYREAFHRRCVVVAVAYQPETWAAGILMSRASEAGDKREPWIDLDRQLRSVARRRAALDHEELTLIREALRVQLWRPLGMTSMREYMEVVLGYSPHVASERLRVAEALDALPAIDNALATGELSYSAVRELTRIATRRTEAAWLDAARGKNLRQIEELVAEREPGDAPGDEPKPDLRPRMISMLLRPVAEALLRSARQSVEAARSERIDDSDLIEELCRAYLAGAGEGEGAGPRAHIAITRDDTGQARQHAAGRKIAITDAEYETAACDAVMIGSLDGAPERASSTIPPATRRFVLHRDGGRCTVPGCRAARNLDVHHLLPREHGGDHTPENLTTLCSGHHAALHRGELCIEGAAPTITVTRRAQIDVRSSHVGCPVDRSSHVGLRGQPSSHVGLHDEAVLALTTLGFKKTDAVRAVERARETLAGGASLEEVLRAALQECPR
jgi:hypothetical protein